VKKDQEAFVNFVKEFTFKQNSNNNNNDKINNNFNSQNNFNRDKIDRKRKQKDGDNGEVKTWEQYYEELKQFQALQGHCYVPYDWDEDVQFAQWVSRQRVRKNKGKLSPERTAKLEEIGFLWSAVEGGAFKLRWEEKYEDLKKYKEEYGDCNVPYRWPDNPQLANWVFRQREHRKAGKLSEEREAKLTELSFVWGLNSAVSKHHRWDMRFAELVEYKSQFGHCCVPNVFKKNQQLANWVRKQRELLKKDKMPLERVIKLDKLGFIWKVGAGKPKEEPTKKRKR